MKWGTHAASGTQAAPAPAAHGEDGGADRWMLRSPAGVAKRNPPASSQPTQRWRTCRRTPELPRRRARRGTGERPHPDGKTLPEVPTKLFRRGRPSSPGPVRAQTPPAPPPRRSGFAIATQKRLLRLGMGDVESPRPAKREELAPRRGHGIENVYGPTPGSGRLGSHQARRASPRPPKAAAQGASPGAGATRPQWLTVTATSGLVGCRPQYDAA